MKTWLNLYLKSNFVSVLLAILIVQSTIMIVQFSKIEDHLRRQVSAPSNACGDQYSPCYVVTKENDALTVKLDEAIEVNVEEWSPLIDPVTVRVDNFSLDVEVQNWPY